MNKLFVILLVSVSFVTYSQKNTRVGVFGGFGLPEFIHIGMKSQIGQFEAGVFYGSFPSERRLYSVGGHLMWHFAGYSDYLHATPWYLKADLIYNREESSKYIWHNWFSGLRFGRECAFNEKLSLQFDLGASFIVYKKKIVKQSSGWNFDLNIPVIPSASLTLYAGW